MACKTKTSHLLAQHSEPRKTRNYAANNGKNHSTRFGCASDAANPELDSHIMRNKHQKLVPISYFRWMGENESTISWLRALYLPHHLNFKPRK
jgi:hypothetical protein